MSGGFAAYLEAHNHLAKACKPTARFMLYSTSRLGLGSRLGSG